VQAEAGRHQCIDHPSIPYATISPHNNGPPSAISRLRLWRKRAGRKEKGKEQQKEKEKGEEKEKEKEWEGK